MTRFEPGSLHEAPYEAIPLWSDKNISIIISIYSVLPNFSLAGKGPFITGKAKKKCGRGALSWGEGGSGVRDIVHGFDLTVKFRS